MGSVQSKVTCKVRASVSFIVCAPCFLPSQTYILLHIKTFIHAYYAFWSNLAPCWHLQIVPQAPQLYFPPKFLGSFLLKSTRPPWCFLHVHGSRTVCYSMATTAVPRGTHSGRKCQWLTALQLGVNLWWDFVWLGLEWVWLLHSKSLFVNGPAMSGKCHFTTSIHSL